MDRRLHDRHRDVGMRGNSHMMMMDRNNLEIADFLQKWIADNVK